jgi:hypothetical protein
VGRALLDILEKAREGVFDLTQEKVIHAVNVFPIGGRVGTAGHDGFASALGTRNHLL